MFGQVGIWQILIIAVVILRRDREREQTGRTDRPRILIAKGTASMRDTCHV